MIKYQRKVNIIRKVNIKMYFYKIYLKSLGVLPFVNKKRNNLENHIDNNNTDEIKIVIDKNRRVQRIITRDDKWYNANTFKNVINIIYIIFIFCIIGSSCVYNIVKAIETKDLRYISSNMFSYMYVFQFILGILYYRRKHFAKVMIYTKQYSKYYKILIIVGILISAIIPIISVILLTQKINVNAYSLIYDQTSDAGKFFLCVMIVVDKFYAYNIFFANIITFSTIFVVHGINIKNYSKKLNELLNKNLNDSTLHSVIKEFSELKGFHTKSVDKLNNIFSYLTILGMLGCYFTYSNFGTSYVGIITYFDIAWFVIIESIYIYSISCIKDAVSKISDVINTSKSVDVFMSKSKFENIIGDTYESYILSKSNVEELKLIDNKINILDDVNNKDKLKAAMNKKMNFIKELSLRNVITGNETSSSIDWLILNAKLNADWACFQLFGFEIRDTDILKKLIAVITGFLLLSNINNTLHYKL